MVYPLFLNDIIKLASHPSSPLHRLKTPLSNPSAERLKFIVFLAERLNVLSSMGTGWISGERFNELLEGKPGQWWAEFLNAFLEENDWDELALSVKLKSMGNRLSPSRARKFIIENIREGETAREFSSRLKEKAKDFYRKTGGWILKRQGREAEWEELEEKIIVAVIKELRWLAILKGEEPLAFTQEGKLLLEGKIPEVPLEKPLVKPDFEIIAPLNTHPGDIFFLEKVAEPVSSHGVYTYRITRDSVMRAIETGIETHRIVKRLEEWGTVPENLRDNILQWGARFSRIKLRFGVVIEVEEPHLLKELMHISKLKGLILPLNSKYALVRTENLEEVRRILRTGEYYSEVPGEWDGKRIVFLTSKQAEALKKFLKERVEELKFPFNVIIEEVIEKL